jgi:hypothetical protein
MNLPQFAASGVGHPASQPISLAGWASASGANTVSYNYDTQADFSGAAWSWTGQGATSASGGKANTFWHGCIQ